MRTIENVKRRVKERFRSRSRSRNRELSTPPPATSALDTRPPDEPTCNEPGPARQIHLPAEPSTTSATSPEAGILVLPRIAVTDDDENGIANEPVPPDNPEAERSTAADDSALLWKRAYDSLCADEEELIGHVEAVLKDSASIPQEGDMRSHLADVAKAQEQKFRKKQWRFQWSGKSQHVRDKIESIVGFANQWASVVSTGMTLAPPYVSVPWAVTTALIPMMMNDAKEHKGAIDGLETVTKLVLSYQLAERAFLGRGMAA